MAYKRKIIAVLVAVALGGAALSVCGAETEGSEPAKRLFENSDGVFASEPNFSVGSGEGINTGELFFRMMLSVLLVVVLGVVLIYVLKKFGGRITGLPGRKIRIIETTPLGSRKMLYLLEVGERKILIGSTSENITMLADVTEALSDLSVQETDGNLEDR